MNGWFTPSPWDPPSPPQGGPMLAAFDAHSQAIAQRLAEALAALPGAVAEPSPAGELEQRVRLGSHSFQLLFDPATASLEVRCCRDDGHPDEAAMRRMLRHNLRKLQDPITLAIDAATGCAQARLRLQPWMLDGNEDAAAQGAVALLLGALAQALDEESAA